MRPWRLAAEPGLPSREMWDDVGAGEQEPLSIRQLAASYVPLGQAGVLARSESSGCLSEERREGASSPITTPTCSTGERWAQGPELQASPLPGNVVPNLDPNLPSCQVL